jgi:predicted 3-demethylubiquinone-9 3-methyltransferase (glyoxalase superfamily)
MTHSQFIALNGGPEFTFSPAISFSVNCNTQQDIDGMWDKLSEGGAKNQCGWLTDRYGVSWQIVPARLNEMMQSGNAERSQRVMDALLKMNKLDIDTLIHAYESV